MYEIFVTVHVMAIFLSNLEFGLWSQSNRIIAILPGSEPPRMQTSLVPRDICAVCHDSLHY